MSATQLAVPPSVTVAALTPTQQRVVAAAHDLFAERGISGTSLQMIAASLGVTKAAVYHQFPSKDDLVIAVTATELVTLEVALAAADAEPDKELARDRLIQQMVDEAVRQRQRITLMQHDPVVSRLLDEHEPFRQLMDRLYAILAVDDSPDTKVQAAMLATAIGACSVHPLVADLDDEVLHQQMLHYARWLARIPYVPPAG
ncbi:MAG TPA: helix-turn-helix domain-containing protein [Acidimicrobiales bacterium]